MSFRKTSNISLSSADIYYLWFAKKVCPVCGGKLKKQSKLLSTKKTTTGFGDIDTNLSGNVTDSLDAGIIQINLGGGTRVPTEIKDYGLNYHCAKCNKTFPVSELSKSAPKNGVRILGFVLAAIMSIVMFVIFYITIKLFIGF